MAQGLLVSFFVEAVHMAKASELANRPIYEDREFVRIIPIGDNKSEVVEEASQMYKDRFPDEYARFQKGEKEQQTGTPLKEWSFIRPSQIKMLNYLNIFTVENLATCGDDSIQRMGPGGRQLVHQAQAYLMKAKDGAVASQFAAENAELKEKVTLQAEQISTMRSQIDELLAAKSGKKAA